MGSRHVSQLVRLFITFVTVLGGLWLFVEFISYFFASTVGVSLSTWNKGSGFWVLISIAIVVSFVRLRYASFLGLETSKGRDDVGGEIDFTAPKHSRNRKTVLSNVSVGYIDGVLHHALQNTIPLSSGKYVIQRKIHIPREGYNGNQLEFLIYV